MHWLGGSVWPAYRISHKVCCFAHLICHCMRKNTRMGEMLKAILRIPADSTSCYLIQAYLVLQNARKCTVDKWEGVAGRHDRVLNAFDFQQQCGPWSLFWFYWHVNGLWHLWAQGAISNVVHSPGSNAGNGAFCTGYVKEWCNCVILEQLRPHAVVTVVSATC